MSKTKTPDPEFQLTADGKWRCKRCGRVEYVQGRLVCLRHQHVRKIRPHKEGNKHDRAWCPGERGKGDHEMMQGYLKCMFCHPFPTPIKTEMRVREQPTADSTTKVREANPPEKKNK